MFGQVIRELVRTQELALTGTVSLKSPAAFLHIFACWHRLGTSEKSIARTHTTAKREWLR